MSALELRTLPFMYTRTTRRRKTALDVDLNVVPPSVNRDQEGTSSQAPSEDGGGAGPQGGSLPVPTINVDDDASTDDDVIIASPRAFTEAKNNSGRSRRGPIVIIDVDSEEFWTSTVTSRNLRRRHPTGGQTIINCDYYINLERENIQRMAPPSPTTPPPPPPPTTPPPPEPTFSCPVCMGPLEEEMSTKCGHIFCKSCIKAAIAAQKKCPTCRRKTTMKDIIRVYLPTTN